ncbi:MAG: phosphoribosyl-ATP diphosphatase [Thermaurantiacus sp.]
MSEILARLEAVIAERWTTLATDPSLAERSHVARLMAKGLPKVAEKFGEEAVETLIAALAEDEARLAAEAADLLFHLLVLLGARGVTLDAVLTELARREGQSGVAEKEARK